MTFHLTPCVARWLLAGYLLVMLGLVFEPAPVAADDGIAVVARGFADIGLGKVMTLGVCEFLLNVALFIPPILLGSVVVRRLSWLQWLGLGFLVSCGIELTQLVFFPGRTASLVDIVANTTGALIGALVAARIRRRQQRRGRILVPAGPGQERRK
ncbi:MAG: VanZ family protein [Nocardioidaceae bacterium]